MSPSGRNSYLTISCSLSLLLISIFIFIDKGKVDKKKLTISPQEQRNQIKKSESFCSSDSSWANKNSISSINLNQYVEENSKSTILEPDTYAKIHKISDCIKDKNLHVETSLKKLNSDGSDKKLQLIINKYYSIKAAFSDYEIAPREIQLSIKME